MTQTLSHKRNILVVDDDPDFLKYLTNSLASLKSLGIVVATNAAEARLRMRFQKFDMIITDLVMPKENGVQFLVSLHNSTESQGIPSLVVITGCNLNDALKLRLTKFLRVELILEKPVDIEILKQFITKRLNLTQKSHAYDAKTMNKFLTATVETIGLNTRTKPEPGKPFVRTDNMALGEFTGIIELSNPKQRGIVALSFERTCCDAMARRILFDENIQATDTMLRDIAGEMCNQVAGNTQAQFNREGIRFEISIPTIISGVNYRIDHHIQAPCIVIPFMWEEHRFYTQFIMENINPA